MTYHTTTTRPGSAEPSRRGGEQRRPGELPPGQRLIDWFPRFGTHSQRPTPTIPDDPVVEIGGVVTEPFAVRVADLAVLPRRRLDADFHCVSGWTAAGLHWEGVAFAEFYRLRIVPSLCPGAVVTHVKFCGLDGFGSVVTIEDALDHDVLLADHLDGEPLGNDHGAPLRVVSPAQYGYISTKHLSRIEVHTAAPTGGPRSFVLDVLLHSHPRARVWEEERHGTLPGAAVRPFYRAIAKVMLRRSRRSSRRPPPTGSRRIARYAPAPGNARATTRAGWVGTRPARLLFHLTTPRTRKEKT